MFQDIIPIPTDNFYKFLAIFGLVATIYCASFPIIFIKPYNDKMDEQNYLRTDLKAKEGYLIGTIVDLKNKIPDSIKSNNIPYYWTVNNKARDSANYSSQCYFYMLTEDSAMNKNLTKLNTTYLEYAKTDFRLSAMDISYDVDSRNIDLHQKINYFLTAFTFSIMLLGMILWWKDQKKINKNQAYQNNSQLLLEGKLKLEEEKLKSNN